MTQTVNAVTIRAPRDRVFDMAEDKAGFPDFMPHLLESREIREGSRVAYRMAARMRLGFVSRWVSERVAMEPGRWAAYRTTGFCRRMEGRWSVEAVEPGADGAPRTRLTLTHDYEVGHPLLSRLLPLERLVTTCVHDNAQRMLEALRERIEAGVPCRRKEALHA